MIVIEVRSSRAKTFTLQTRWRYCLTNKNTKLGRSGRGLHDLFIYFIPHTNITLHIITLAMCYIIPRSCIIYSEAHLLSVSCFFLDLKLVRVWVPDGKTTQIYSISGMSYSCTQPACSVPICTYLREWSANKFGKWLHAYTRRRSPEVDGSLPLLQSAPIHPPTHPSLSYVTTHRSTRPQCRAVFPSAAATQKFASHRVRFATITRTHKIYLFFP